MKVGTKSVLFGAHAFWLHPWFLALAWWRLYSFPWDPRLWVAFFVHDLGYWGKTEMDSDIGQSHPYLGAKIMRWLFDARRKAVPDDRGSFFGGTVGAAREASPSYRAVFARPSMWYWFTLLHSRYLSKRLGMKTSKLCAADKLATAMTPSWLYLTMVTMTGEIEEYMKGVVTSYERGGSDIGARWYVYSKFGWKREWFEELTRYVEKWAYANA